MITKMLHFLPPAAMPLLVEHWLLVIHNECQALSYFFFMQCLKFKVVDGIEKWETKIKSELLGRNRSDRAGMKRVEFE